MSETGLLRRMRHCFRADGRTFIVAMDHSSFMDSTAAGLGAAGATIGEARAAGADAFMIPRGTMNAWPEAMADAGLILSLSLADPGYQRAVEVALAAGADMVKVMLYPFTTTFDHDAGALNHLASECERWGVPLMVETVPGGFAAGSEMRTPERLAAAARIGVELGARVIKTFYPGDAAGMALLAGYVPVPVVVLGGEKTENVGEFLDGIATALSAGAAGVAVGRNVWASQNVGAIAQALAAVVHDGVAGQEAAVRFGF